LAGSQLGVLSGRLRHLPWGSGRHVLLKIQKAFTHLHDITVSSQWTREKFKQHRELLHQLNSSWIFKKVLNCGIENSYWAIFRFSSSTEEMRWQVQLFFLITWKEIKEKEFIISSGVKSRSRLVPSSWMLSLHLRSTYASLLCRFECVRTLTCCIMHCHFLLVSVIVGNGLDELGLIPSRRRDCSVHHYVDCSLG
jgi:hypothetical protein